MVQGERRLDHAGHAGRRFEVADGVLDRPDDQVGGAALDPAQGLTDGGHLQRIADRGTGAVRLDVADLFRAQTGLGGHPADEVCLRLGVGDGDTGRASVLVDAGGPDHGVDPVMIAGRVRERLERENAGSFTAGIAVRGGVKGLAVAVLGEEPALAHPDEHLRSEHRVHPADQGELDLAAGDRLGGLVQGDQGGRAGGVDGHARPAQVIHERDPVGQHREHAGRRRCGSSSPARLAGRWRSTMLSAVKATDVDADRPTGDPAGHPGIVHRFLGDLQQQPLLRVH